MSVISHQRASKNCLPQLLLVIICSINDLMSQLQFFISVSKKKYLLALFSHLYSCIQLGTFEVKRWSLILECSRTTFFDLLTAQLFPQHFCSDYMGNCDFLFLIAKGKNSRGWLRMKNKQNQKKEGVDFDMLVLNMVILFQLFVILSSFVLLEESIVETNTYFKLSQLKLRGIPAFCKYMFYSLLE